MSRCKTKLAALFIVLGAVLYPYIYKYKAGCVFESSGDKPRLDDKVALITGANTGIGYETAYELSRRGCKVILACRDDTRCSKAKVRLESALVGAKVRRAGSLFLLHLDLADLRSVREAALRVRSEQTRLDFLVLNAGVMALPVLQRTQQGHEMHFGVNHLGHFLLTKLLLPFMKLKAHQEPVRVISVSSMGHYRMFASRMNLTDLGLTSTYSGFHAYSQSKLANVLHMRELASQEIHSLPEGQQWPQVIAVSLHPGAVATELMRYIPYYEFFEPLQNFFTYFITKTPWEGAQTTMHCLLTKSDSLLPYNGEYFHDCEPRATSVDAHSIVDARALWILSEKLVAEYLD